MAEITAAMVRDLREKTGAGMMDCKKALTETDGELEAAIDPELKADIGCSTTGLYELVGA